MFFRARLFFSTRFGLHRLVLHSDSGRFLFGFKSCRLRFGARFSFRHFTLNADSYRVLLNLKSCCLSFSTCLGLSHCNLLLDSCRVLLSLDSRHFRFRQDSCFLPLPSFFFSLRFGLSYSSNLSIDPYLFIFCSNLTCFKLRPFFSCGFSCGFQCPVFISSIRTRKIQLSARLTGGYLGCYQWKFGAILDESAF